MNIAYAEVSNINGVDYKFNTKVEKIEKKDEHWVLHTNDGDFETKAVINCAGIYSDELHNQILIQSMKSRQDVVNTYF